MMAPELLSSVHGEIRAVLLVYPGWATPAGDAEYAEIVSVFDAKGTVYRFRQEVPGFSLRLSALRAHPVVPGETRTLIDLQPSLRIHAMLESWGEEIRSVGRSGRLSYRRWAQDPFLVLAAENWLVLLEPLGQRRLCDFFLPLELAQQVGPHMLVRPTRLYLEGGNVLRGGRLVFVGEDLVRENMRLLNLPAAAVLDELRLELGVGDLLRVGLDVSVPRLQVDGGGDVLTWQPLFHIDLFICLGGLDARSGQELVFLGCPALCRTVLSGTAGALAAEDEARAAGYFDAVGTGLTAAGCRVLRVPIFFYEGRTYSWNNCLVEVYGNAKRVYLPSYVCDHDPEQLNPGFRALEAVVEGVFAGEGFLVHWFRDGRLFRTLAEHGGSLHCAVKVMERGGGV